MDYIGFMNLLSLYDWGVFLEFLRLCCIWLSIVFGEFCVFGVCKIKYFVFFVVVMVIDYLLNGLVLRISESERVVVVIDLWMYVY